MPKWGSKSKVNEEINDEEEKKCLNVFVSSLVDFSHQADHLSKQGKQLEEMQQVMSKIRNTINSVST